jgi:hypothetical protein
LNWIQALAFSAALTPPSVPPSGGTSYASLAIKTIRSCRRSLRLSSIRRSTTSACGLARPPVSRKSVVDIGSFSKTKEMHWNGSEYLGLDKGLPLGPIYSTRVLQTPLLPTDKTNTILDPFLISSAHFGRNPRLLIYERHIPSRDKSPGCVRSRSTKIQPHIHRLCCRFIQQLHWGASYFVWPKLQWEMSFACDVHSNRRSIIHAFLWLKIPNDRLQDWPSLHSISDDRYTISKQTAAVECRRVSLVSLIYI